MGERMILLVVCVVLLLTSFQVEKSTAFTFTVENSLRSNLPLLASHFHDTQNEVASSSASRTRRSFMNTVPTATASIFGASTMAQAVPTASSTRMENGLLESRVMENLLSPPTYGMESPDVFYPSSFEGTWQVTSTTTDVQAPCGSFLFGGNATFARATKEVGTTLNYRARFIPSTFDFNDASSSRKVSIADREFNVREIAKAAMGINSVLDVPLVSPNKLTCMLAPSGAGAILQADLLTLARRQETIEQEREFHCSEVVRQIIAPANTGNGASSPSTLGTRGATLLKEIETVSLYTITRDEDDKVKKIACRQRSATFLLPSQQDPTALQMWQMTKNRPIDVRFYDVVYEK